MRALFFLMIMLLCTSIPVLTPVFAAEQNPASGDRIYGTSNSRTHTWVDPTTGDIITSVVPPTPQQQPYPYNTPIIVYPEITPENWTRPHNSTPPASLQPPPPPPPPPGFTPHLPPSDIRPPAQPHGVHVSPHDTYRPPYALPTYTPPTYTPPTYTPPTYTPPGYRPPSSHKPSIDPRPPHGYRPPYDYRPPHGYRPPYDYRPPYGMQLPHTTPHISPPIPPPGMQLPHARQTSPPYEHRSR